MCKIMPVQTLSNLWSAGFGLKLNSPNIPKLEYLKSIKITRVQVCFKNTFASTAGHFKEFMSLPFIPFIFYFFIQFQKWKRLAHFIWLILLLTCKNLCGYWILMVAVSGKKKSIVKTVALNCISPEVYRVTHHAQTHKCYLRKPNKKKYNYLIQSNAYLGRKSINWNQWTTF